ncbi:AAA family ATPase (plasmid) [Exiguobacterium acetylicum]|uniref:AAA family ATPase n=1 Tax=Exiguobacterium acetylicum TaxID=41170 RepID=UPI0039777BFF
MQLKEISIKNFKSLKDFKLIFPPSNIIGENGDKKIKVSVLIGENGTSKTTILQSIIEAFSFRNIKNNAKKPHINLTYEISKKTNTVSNLDEFEKNEFYPKNIIVSSYAMIDKLSDYSFPSQSNIKIIGLNKERSISNKGKLRKTANDILKEKSTDNLFSILKYIGFPIDELKVGLEISSYALRMDSRKIEKIYGDEEVMDYLKANYDDYLLSSSNELIDKFSFLLRDFSSMLNVRTRDPREKIGTIINELKSKASRYSNDINDSDFDNKIKPIIFVWFALEKIRILSAHNIKIDGISSRSYLFFLSNYSMKYPTRGYEEGYEEFIKDLELIELSNISLVNDLLLINEEKNMQIPLSSLSSGELSMFLRLYDLQANIEENSIVLIDEPETHLHPKWISGFIKTILEMFGNVKCHVIIATHSPLIISDVSKNSIIGLKKRDDLVKQVDVDDKTLGLNYDDVLSEILNLKEDGAMIYEYRELILNALEHGELDLALEIYSQMADSEIKFEMFRKIKNFKESPSN